MEKVEIVATLGKLLRSEKKQECIEFAEKHYPFTIQSVYKRKYSKYQMCRIFLRDGFIDRYSGARLLFPGMIKILSIEFPNIFKYHRNWKMTDTHMIYWELFPTIDHLIPIARGGTNDENNCLTTSMMRNSAKSNWTIEEIGWTVYHKGKLNEWDGLCSLFLDLITANTKYSSDKYIKEWNIALKQSLIKIHTN